MGAITPMTETDHLSDEQVLRFTQKTRKGLVDAMTNQGQKMPDDPKERMLMLQALSDMDRQALTNKRINGDQKNAEADRAAALAAAKLFAQFGNKNPFMKDAPEQGRVIDMPDTLLDNVEVAPGELEIGLSNETYDSFNAKRGEA